MSLSDQSAHWTGSPTRWRLVSLSGFGSNSFSSWSWSHHLSPCSIQEASRDRDGSGRRGCSGVGMVWNLLSRVEWTATGAPCCNGKAAAHSAHWAVQSSVSHYEKVEKVFHSLGETSVRGHHGIRLLVNLESYYAGAHKGQESSSEAEFSS